MLHCPDDKNYQVYNGLVLINKPYPIHCWCLDVVCNVKMANIVIQNTNGSPEIIVYLTDI